MFFFGFVRSFVRSEARARKEKKKKKKNERPLSNANEKCVPSQSGENFEGGGKVGVWALCVGAATNER